MFTINQIYFLCLNALKGIYFSNKNISRNPCNKRMAPTSKYHLTAKELVPVKC